MAETHHRHPHEQHEDHESGVDQSGAVRGWRVGQAVWADFGNGKVIGLLTDLGHEVKGADGKEIKFGVQNPKTGESEDLGYREPESGSDTGRTFWAIPQ